MDKDFTLALIVPGIWLGDVLFLVLYTLVSPILFIAALFVPYSPQEIINSIFGGGSETTE